MPPTKLDQFIISRLSRAIQGDDEALNVIVLEVRPLALQCVPREAYQGAPVDVCANEATIALHEALILWVPQHETFAACLERRVVQRIRALFLRLMDLRDTVRSLPLEAMVEALDD